MTNFVDYRDGPGGKIAEVILGKSIKQLDTWAAFFEFTYAVGNTGTAGQKMIQRAETAYATGHVGQRAVILATLFAMDRSAHAVRIEAQADENLLGIMNYVDKPHSAAVAACLQLRD